MSPIYFLAASKITADVLASYKVFVEFLKLLVVRLPQNVLGYLVMAFLNMLWFSLSSTSSFFTAGPIWTIASSLLSGVMGFVALLLVIRVGKKEDPSDFRLTLIGVIAGAALGWAIGMLVSPKNSDEEALFGRYQALVGGFVSGFLSSKFTTLFNNLQDKGAFTNRAALSKIMSFAAALLFAMLVVYSVRASASYYGTISISPKEATVAPKGTQQFSAQVQNQRDTSAV